MYILPLSHLCGVTGEGLVFISPESTSRLKFNLPHDSKMKMLKLFKSGFDALQSIGLDSQKEAQLTTALLDAGFIREGRSSEEPLPDEVTPLGDAIVRLVGNNKVSRFVTTAEEVLVLPVGADAALTKRAVRAFIANIEPEERLYAYGYCAGSEEVTVVGDQPPRALLAQVVEQSQEWDEDMVHVVDLPDLKVTSIERNKVLRGWQNDSRLGIVRYTVVNTSDLSRSLGVHLCSSKYACPNLLFAEDHKDAACMGLASTAAEARVIAYAEATERFVSGEVAERQLQSGTEGELPAPVCDPRSLIKFNERQYRSNLSLHKYEPSRPYHWIEGKTLSGSARWVPAELTLFPFPGSSLAASNSSGIAAHTSYDEAIKRAVFEVIERDAYMWTWLQRVSRERISAESLPEEFSPWLERLNQVGYSADFVNLTLETLPVILCAVHTKRTLILGSGCAFDAESAARKALYEAGSVLWGGDLFQPEEEIQLEDVHSATDHQKLYTDSTVAEGAAFLHSSTELTDLQDVHGHVGKLSQIGSVVSEPVVVDLTLPLSEGLHVVRAFIPGLLPITFGYDQEPYGMSRAGETIQIDDRVLGRRIDFSDYGPTTPHPFA
ncbi:MAG: YcaO-like family protein [Patescibacteria group bacterium]